MSNEYSDTYEIATKYSTLIHDLVYPTKPNKPYESDFGKNYRAYADAREKYDEDMIQYRNYLNKYREQENNYLNQFQIDLLEYLEISNHPKASKLYSMAWEDGHSSGLSEVGMKAEWLVELLI